jgi:hypothetical protein
VSDDDDDDDGEEDGAIHGSSGWSASSMTRAEQRRNLGMDSYVPSPAERYEVMEEGHAARPQPDREHVAMERTTLGSGMPRISRAESAKARVRPWRVSHYWRLAQRPRRESEVLLSFVRVPMLVKGLITCRLAVLAKDQRRISRSPGVL